VPVRLLRSHEGVDEPDERRAEPALLWMAFRQLLEDVEEAEQRPALSPAPAVPVGLSGPLEEEVREEPVRLLEERDQRERLADAGLHVPLVVRVCDYVYCLDFGQMLAEGLPNDVRNHPQVVAAYLGEDPDEDEAI